MALINIFLMSLWSEWPDCNRIACSMMFILQSLGLIRVKMEDKAGCASERGFLWQVAAVWVYYIPQVLKHQDSNCKSGTSQISGWQHSSYVHCSYWVWIFFNGFRNFSIKKCNILVIITTRPKQRLSFLFPSWSLKLDSSFSPNLPVIRIH